MELPPPSDAPDEPSERDGAPMERAANGLILAQTPAQAFQCSQCGECCSQVSVPIDAAKARALCALPWAQERLNKHNARLLPLDRAAERWLLPHTAQGYCVFLDDDGRCMIETREGLALKPDECRRYPFAVIGLPDGTAGVDYSLSCKSLAAGLLAQAGGVLPASGAPQASVETPFPQRVRTQGRRRIHWRTFQAFRQTLSSLFYATPLTPDAAVRQTWRWIQTLRDHDPPAVPPPPELDSAGAAFRIAPFWERLLLIVCLRRPYGALSFWSLLTQGDYVDPKIFGRQTIPLRRLDEVAWPSQTLDPLVNAFVAAFLRRHVLIAYGHSLASMALIALGALALVRWYARALAWSQAKAAPDRADARLAIRLVERYYTGHQPAFPERFRRLPGKTLLLRRMLRA